MNKIETAAMQFLSDMGITFDRGASSHLKALLTFQRAIRNTRRKSVFQRHYAIMSPYLPDEPVGCTWGANEAEALGNLEDAKDTVVLMAQKHCPVCNEAE